MAFFTACLGQRSAHESICPWKVDLGVPEPTGKSLLQMCVRNLYGTSEKDVGRIWPVPTISRMVAVSWLHVAKGCTPDFRGHDAGFPVSTGRSREAL